MSDSDERPRGVSEVGTPEREPYPPRYATLADEFEATIGADPQGRDDALADPIPSDVPED